MQGITLTNFIWCCANSASRPLHLIFLMRSMYQGVKLSSVHEEYVQDSGAVGLSHAPFTSILLENQQVVRRPDDDYFTACM